MHVTDRWTTQNLLDGARAEQDTSTVLGTGLLTSLVGEKKCRIRTAQTCHPTGSHFDIRLFAHVVRILYVLDSSSLEAKERAMSATGFKG